MARWNSGIGTLLLMALLCAGLAGCAKYQAKSAFEEAEELAKAEQFDQAVEKYFEATENDPGSKTYKLKLIASRTRAAAFHIGKARAFARDGRVDEALAQYRLARGFDPSLEVAALEAKQLEGVLRAGTLAEEGFTRYREKRYAAARLSVVEALKLDPQNARALELQKLLETKYQPVIMDGIELEMASNEPITLRFKQANIKEVFGILTQLSGINFILDEELKDKPLTVLLEKATFSQAMELILSMAGLNKKVLNSKTMIVFPNNKDKGKQYEDQIIQTFYLSHIDAKKAVNLLRTMLQLRKVYVHEERNALVVRDTPQTITLAEQILLAADRENSEVIFDLELLAVSNTDQLKLGPRLSTYSASVGLSNDGASIISDTLSPGSKTSGLFEDINDLQAFYTLPTATFDLAKTLTDTEILASPKIRVRNSEKAKVHIGTREPVITVTTTGDTSTDNIQYVDVGVKVDVEPTIQLDRSVQTKLSLEVSQVIDRVTTTNGSVALTISTTNAQSVLTLKDGVQTIIGGLFEQNRKDTKQTVPFLGEIPLLGNLLSNLDNSDTKREILLSITPYIVKQIEVPGADVATIWSGGEDDLMARPKFGAFAQPLVSEVDAPAFSAAPASSKQPRMAPGSALRGDSAREPGAAAAPAAPMVPAGSAVPAAQPPMPTVEELQQEKPPLMPQMAPAVEGPEASAPVPLPAAAPEVPAVVPAVVPATSPDEPAAVPAAVPAEPAAVPLPPAPTEAVPAPAATPPPVAEPVITLPMPPKAPARLSLASPEVAALGQEFGVTVQIDGVERLYSAPLFVSYDPALLELVGVEEGSFLAQGGQSTVFSHSPNSATGQVVVGYKQGVGGPGASGSGQLFTLRLRAKAAGTARIELNRINFRDPSGNRLTVQPSAVSVTVK